MNLLKTEDSILCGLHEAIKCLAGGKVLSCGLIGPLRHTKQVVPHLAAEVEQPEEPLLLLQRGIQAVAVVPQHLHHLYSLSGFISAARTCPVVNALHYHLQNPP